MKQAEEKPKDTSLQDFEEEEEDYHKITFSIGRDGKIGWILTSCGIAVLIVGIRAVVHYHLYLIFLLFLPLLTVGLTLIVIGIYVLVKVYADINFKKEAVRSGQFVYAVVSDISIDNSKKIDGVTPWKVTADYHDNLDQRDIEFTGRSIRSDISLIQKGDFVRVYANAPLYTAWYMDIDELLRNKDEEF